ncbi:MAG: hypothetical protein LIO76_08135 [Clostridiales bacterium]|nr:hypothetical protein [Clostridiales bacterium]
MALMLSLMLFLKADCVRVSAQSVSDVTKNEILTEEEAFSEKTSLTELRADFLTEGEYQYAEQYGANLLLIRMYVPETKDAVTYIDGDGEIFYEENYCYQFDLYSPEENAVTASLDTEDQAADFYLIDGAGLLLVDYEQKQISSYDESLSLLASYDISSFLDASDGFVYAAADEDSWYFLNYEENALQKAAYADGICTLSDGGLDSYCPVIHMASPDASKMLLTVVDKDTYLSSCVVLESGSLSVLRSYSQENFIWQTISDEAFLAQSSDGAEPYFCDWFDGEAAWFAVPEDISVSLADEYVLAVRDTLYAGEEEEPVYSASLYDHTGACISSMSFSGDKDGDGEADAYMLSNPIYLEEQQSVFWLMGETAGEEESGTYLLKWNLEAGSASEQLLFYDTAAEVPGDTAETAADDGTLVTAIPDRAGYDWGSLANVRSRADALEEKYGISVYLGGEVPEQVGNYRTEACLDEETLSVALDQLELILALYPENFFPQLLYDDLRGIRIYISGTLSGEMEGMLRDPGAYVEEINHFQVMVLDAYQNWNWDYMLNHEISHMIDRSLSFRSIYQTDALFSEETWSSYNPDDFDYLYTYDGYEENADWEKYPEYFVDAYGTTFATEDRAEIFGTAVSGCLYEGLYDDLFAEGSVLKEKLDYYCACIRDGFDTAGWEERMAWETD